MSSEQEFWAAETARRMAEYNQRALANAREQAAALRAQPDYGLDGARHRAMAEERERDARQRAAEAETHARAVAAKRAKYGWTLSDIDWDAPSQTEQAYQAQQAEYDRQRRWAAYATERMGKVFNLDGTPRQYDVTAPPQWFK